MLKKLVGGILITTFIFGQTTANPQFSVIGDLVIDHLNKNTSLLSSGIEMAIQGYVNPFARADIYLHKHNDTSPIELEEAVMTIEKGLPFGLGIRAGKFRPDLGKINQIHAHLFPYIEAPSGMAKILGEEFWSATGVETNVFLPLPWYSNFSLSYFDSGIGSHDHSNHEKDEDHDKEKNEDHDKDKDDHDHDEKDYGSDKQTNAFTVRWSHFFELNDVNHLELGLSGYSGQDEGILGADFKYKWRPNKYRSLTIQAEVLQHSLEDEYMEKAVHPDELLTAAYAMVNFQFNKAYNFGAMIDYWSLELADDEGMNPSIFFGYSPVEESAVLRLKIGQLEDEGHHKKHLKTTVQIIWSLGPHKPHRY